MPSGPSVASLRSIEVSGYRDVTLPDSEEDKLISAIENTVGKQSATSAPARLEPDLRFDVELPAGQRILEFLAGGSVLRDAVTRQVWQFNEGREILQKLMPYSFV